MHFRCSGLQSRANFEGGGAFDIVSPTLQKVVSSSAAPRILCPWWDTGFGLAQCKTWVYEKGGQKTRGTFDVVSPTLRKWGVGGGHVPSTLLRGRCKSVNEYACCEDPVWRRVRARLRARDALIGALRCSGMQSRSIKKLCHPLLPGLMPMVGHRVWPINTVQNSGFMIKVFKKVGGGRGTFDIVSSTGLQKMGDISPSPWLTPVPGPLYLAFL